MAEAGTRAARRRAKAAGLHVIVMVTVDEDGNCLDGTSAEEAARRITAWGADAVGCNCSEGPDDRAQRHRAHAHGHRTSRWPPCPTPARPREVEGRNIYLTSPEYMASFAKKFVKAGARFVGGCCGTTPQHIRSMRGALRALEAQDHRRRSGRIAAQPPSLPNRRSIEPPPLGERSDVGGMIAAGEFCTLVEIVPPKGFDCSKELDGAAELRTRSASTPSTCPTAPAPAPA